MHVFWNNLCVMNTYIHRKYTEVFSPTFLTLFHTVFFWVPPLLMPASFTVFIYVTLYLCTWVNILLPRRGRPRSQAMHIFFWCQLNRLSCLLGRFISAQLGSFPLVPTTSLGSRFPSRPEVTPLRTQLPWLIMAESHLRGSVSGHDFHGWSVPRAMSTLLTGRFPPLLILRVTSKGNVASSH